MKNGVFEPFRVLRIPSASKKMSPEGPVFAHSPPVLCILFWEFCRFFHFRTNAFLKKVNAKFFCGVDFLQPSTAKFFYFCRKALCVSHLQTPLKIGLFSAVNAFFQTTPCFLGGKSTHFLKTRPKVLTIWNLQKRDTLVQYLSASLGLNDQNR